MSLFLKALKNYTNKSEWNSARIQAKSFYRVNTNGEKYCKEGLIEEAMENHTANIANEKRDEESEDSASNCYQNGRISKDTASEDI